MRNVIGLIFCGLLALTPQSSAAQSTTLAFGQVKTDPTQQVELTSDTLDVNQADGTATFIGNVLIIQGEMRLSAERVLVVNRQSGSGIERLEATGNVILVSGQDAAESQFARYNVDTGTIVMTGSVLLSQGPSTLTSEKMTVNLATGEATLAGRVRTILNTGGQNE